jgi:hypothetical protein
VCHPDLGRRLRRLNDLQRRQHRRLHPDRQLSAAQRRDRVLHGPDRHQLYRSDAEHHPRLRHRHQPPDRRQARPGLHPEHLWHRRDDGARPRVRHQHRDEARHLHQIP